MGASHSKSPACVLRRKHVRKIGCHERGGAPPLFFEQVVFQS